MAQKLTWQGIDYAAKQECELLSLAEGELKKNKEETSDEKIDAFLASAVKGGKVNERFLKAASRLLSSYFPRAHFCFQGGFVLLDNGSIRLIKELNQSIVSVGSGTGWMEAVLEKAGVDIIATDIKPKGDQYGFVRRWSKIKRLKAATAVLKYSDRAVLMSWPCMNEWAYKTIKAMKKGSTLIYFGEGKGGCNANDNFFGELKRSFKRIKVHYYRRWIGINDSLKIYVKIKRKR